MATCIFKSDFYKYIYASLIYTSFFKNLEGFPYTKHDYFYFEQLIDANYLNTLVWFCNQSFTVFDIM